MLFYKCEPRQTVNAQTALQNSRYLFWTML